MSTERSDPNPHLTPKRRSLPREMTAWGYDAIKHLFGGNEDFALYAESADHAMVFFWADRRFWLFSRPPKGGYDQAAPEVVEDWIGSTAEKEPGAEPVLMHRDELPAGAQSVIEGVQEDPPEHVYDRLERLFPEEDT